MSLVDSTESTPRKHRQVDNQDGEVGENPRQRSRILDKRNPLATEYQSIGDIGSVLLADIDSEGIDNRARFPFEDPFEGSRRAASGSISYNYNDLSGSGFLQGKGSYRQVFGEEGKWALSLKGERTGVDHTFERAGTRWRLRDFEGQEIFLLDRLRATRKTIRSSRNKAVFSLDRLLGKRHQLYFKSHFEEREDTESDQRMRMAIGQGEVVHLDERSGRVVDAASERSIRDFSERREVMRFLVGGSSTGESTFFDFSYYTSSWEREEMGNLNPVFRLEGVDYAYSLADPAFPSVEVLNGEDLNDLSAYHFEEYTERDVRTIDNDDAVQVNFEKRMEIGSFGGLFQTGAVYRSKERTNDYDQVAVDGFDGEFSMDRVAGAEVGRIVRGAYDFGSGMDPAAFRELAQTEAGRFQFNPGRSRLESDTSNYRASEEVIGAYLLQTLRSRRWHLKGGIRFERTLLATAGNAVLTDAEGDYIATRPVSDLDAYIHWLPSVEFEYTVNEGTKLNTAWFQTLARPDYFDLVPYRRLYENFQFILEGNPHLNPTKFDNFVASAHFKNESIGDVSIAGYYKKLEAFFYDSDFVITGGLFDGWTRRRKENGNGGSVWGAEIGWKRKAAFIPASWGELTLTAFYTFSQTAAEADSRPGEDLLLPERARHSASFKANHNFGPLESRFSLTYRSSFLDRIGAELGMDEFMDDFVGMDLAFNLRLSKSAQSYLKYSNFNDRPERSFEGVPSRLAANEYGSWKIEAGMRFNF